MFLRVLGLLYCVLFVYSRNGDKEEATGPPLEGTSCGTDGTRYRDEIKYKNGSSRHRWHKLHITSGTGAIDTDTTRHRWYLVKMIPGTAAVFLDGLSSWRRRKFFN